MSSLAGPGERDIWGDRKFEKKIRRLLAAYRAARTGWMRCAKRCRANDRHAQRPRLDAGGAPMRPRKTDYGTIILHWLLVAAAGTAFLTGLRIASEAPDRAWLDWLDALLPRANVWVPHMQA